MCIFTHFVFLTQFQWMLRISFYFFTFSVGSHHPSENLLRFIDIHHIYQRIIFAVCGAWWHKWFVIPHSIWCSWLFCHVFHLDKWWNLRDFKTDTHARYEKQISASKVVDDVTNMKLEFIALWISSQSKLSAIYVKDFFSHANLKWKCYSCICKKRIIFEMEKQIYATKDLMKQSFF